MARQPSTLLDKQLKYLFVQKQLTCAVAESCTGGLISARLTTLSGSSSWFDCGLVTYSNAAKHQFLGVSHTTLEKFGAVSQDTVIAMAEGILKNTQVNLGLAVTGIAGPTGGSIEKPVGTVWFAWSSQTQPTRTEMHLLTGSRTAIRKACTQIAMEGLLKSLELEPSY